MGAAIGLGLITFVAIGLATTGLVTALASSFVFADRVSAPGLTICILANTSAILVVIVTRIAIDSPLTSFNICVLAIAIAAVGWMILAWATVFQKPKLEP